ncbi:CNX1E [Blepharisma stoltei]|uniref:MoaB/Mog domain-containing protein n=1 Tax=Blepharisma stoltei TaxID=1481888 RepID=A0AAU9ISJ8_9CILI|nr:unnamed protein product [Blepharisma stoltei]
MFSKYPMIEVEEARNIVKSQCENKKIERIELIQGLNRVLAEDIVAKKPFPEFRASTMDGYAVKVQDCPGNLQIDGSIRAGEASNELETGHAKYITTGAPLPKGADAVIPIEEVKIENDTLTVPQAKLGQWIREIGSDIEEGQIVISKNNVLGAAEIALLASLNVREISAIAKIKIGILSTGNELKTLGEETKYGEIIDSNSIMINMLCQEAGCEVKNYGIVKDDLDLVKNTLITMSEECEIIITSGGVSMGDRDFVKPILEQEGQVFFGRLNMKPGKPTTFAKLNNALAFALPGNPVSCFVCFYLLVRYAIDLISSKPEFPIITVNLGSQEIKLDSRPEYHRVIVAWDGSEFKAVTTGSQASSRLLSASKANALLMLPKSSPSLSSISGKVQAILVKPFSNIQPEMKAARISTQHHECPHFAPRNDSVKIGILTISDRVSEGVATDTSGPHLIEKSKELFNGCCTFYQIVPDEIERIRDALLEWCNEGFELIFTTGGTGFSERDVTPEATKMVIEREAPGISTQLIVEGLAKTPLASLSRGVAGIKGRSLIINLPGSLKAVKEGFEILSQVIPHAISILRT